MKLRELSGLELLWIQKAGVRWLSTDIAMVVTKCQYM